MDITLKLKEYGEQKLYLQPYVSNNEETLKEFILVRCKADINNPYLILKLEHDKFEILSQRDLDFDDEEDEDFLYEKLNSLAIKTTEALQQGYDLTAIDIPDIVKSEKPYDPELIRVETSTMSLRQLFDMIKDGDIDLSPDFQRNVVWDSTRKCRLIESILLRIPLPVFYFSADKKDRLSVVDGLQRLTSIKEFMSNQLVLRDLEYLDNCVGRTYNGINKLDEKYIRRFNLTQISVNIIDSKSPTKVKYDIFRRLNTGGRPLNSQELRNCLASKKLRWALKEMAHSSEFLMATTTSISDTRMDAQEYALRFLRFWMLYNDAKGIDVYCGNMDDELNECVDVVSHQDNFPFEDCIAAFKRAMSNAYYLFNRQSFRKVFKDANVNSYRSVINKTLFLSVSVILSKFDPEEIQQKCKMNSWIPILGKQISEDEHYLKMLSYGTNGWKNIKYAFQKFEEIVFKEIKNV